jgi:ubiquinone/menaquinone biosynthesis C-methylase UbiE
MPTTNIPECQSRQSLLNAYFHEEASFWDEIYKGRGVTEIIHQERLRVILTLADKFGRAKKGPLLDVGCGAGLAAVELARRGHAVQALDSVLEMVRLTRTRATKKGLDSLVKCELGDVQALPFADQTFSMVIAAGVLPWLPSIEGAVHEMCRVLEPGGHLIVSVNNRWGLSWFLDPLTNPLLGPVKECVRPTLRRFGDGRPRIGVHLTSIKECEALLQANGMRKVQGTTLGFGPLSLFRRKLLPPAAGVRLHRCLQKLSNRGFPLLRSAGSQYIVVAQKGWPCEGSG